MTIHYTDPFATPEPDRAPVRRLRGRLVAPVTLWTARGRGAPAGLTVSSMLVADGDPGRVLGLVDTESEFWEVVSGSGRFAICPLVAGERAVADRFAGLAPAPGGWFSQDEWVETEFGPVLAGDRTWAGCMLDAHRGYGWGMLIEATISYVSMGSDAATPLAHHRGRYRSLDK